MRRKVMMRAHEIARSLEGDYRARMSMALRQAWQEAKGLTVAAEAREAKINAIEGLKELKAAINEQNDYHYEINRRFENEALSSILPAQPKANVKDLKKKYPRAAAYIKAENWKYANNYAKAAAGRKALERIINGEDHEQVLADMEAEWDAHREENMWN